MLARLGDRKPLVLAIDDLQWGDVDSAALLSELLRPPDPPVLLLVASYRSEDEASSPVPPGLPCPTAYHSIAVSWPIEALTPREARDLALALLGTDGSGASEQADAIARESGGNPLFVAELARHVHVEAGPAQARFPALRRGSHSTRCSGGRISRLPDNARRLLEVIAVSSRPLRQSDACQCTDRLDDERAAMGVLRSGRLIRGPDRRPKKRLRRITTGSARQSLAHLTPTVLSDHHRRLARVLEHSGRADPEALGVHFHGAGSGTRRGGPISRRPDAPLRPSRSSVRPPCTASRSNAGRCKGGRRPGTPGPTRRRPWPTPGRGRRGRREYLQAAEGATVAEALETPTSRGDAVPDQRPCR